MGQFKIFLEDTTNLKDLAEKLHEFSTTDKEGREAWDYASEMMANPEENDPDFDENDDTFGQSDPGNAASYFMDRIFECIRRNEYEGTIVERAGLTDELKALTDKQRDDLYDDLYESVEAGLN